MEMEVHENQMFSALDSQIKEISWSVLSSPPTSYSRSVACAENFHGGVSFSGIG